MEFYYSLNDGIFNFILYNNDKLIFIISKKLKNKLKHYKHIVCHIYCITLHTRPIENLLSNDAIYYTTIK